jgi:ubiquinone biosynthesis protein UbiJ
VPRHEGEQFLRGVEALREDLDRLAARIELLGRRRGPQRSRAS